MIAPPVPIVAIAIDEEEELDEEADVVCDEESLPGRVDPEPASIAGQIPLPDDDGLLLLPPLLPFIPAYTSLSASPADRPADSSCTNRITSSRAWGDTKK